MWQARKGTATLFRADRRSAAISAVTPPLTIEVFLKITQESIIPTPLVTSVFLCHLISPTSLIDEECVAISKILKEYVRQSAFSFDNLINILEEPQFSISDEYSSSINCIVSLNVLFNPLWHKSLIFKTLIEVGGLHSLIGTILIELSSASEFRRASEFTTEILTLLTGSIPLPKPAIPFGKIFFTDITRVYKYLIDLQ